MEHDPTFWGHWIKKEPSKKHIESVIKEQNFVGNSHNLDKMLSPETVKKYHHLVYNTTDAVKEDL